MDLLISLMEAYVGSSKNLSESLKSIQAEKRIHFFGVKLTDERKLALSESKQGINNSMFGKTHTEETKLLIKKS